MMGVIFLVHELGFSFRFFLDQAYSHQKLFPGMIPLPEYRELEWDEWDYHQEKMIAEVKKRNNGNRQQTD